jgi:hypothetical protein
MPYFSCKPSVPDNIARGRSLELERSWVGDPGCTRIRQILRIGSIVGHDHRGSPLAMAQPLGGTRLCCVARCRATAVFDWRQAAVVRHQQTGNVYSPEPPTRTILDRVIGRTVKIRCWMVRALLIAVRSTHIGTYSPRAAAHSLTFAAHHLLLLRG